MFIRYAYLSSYSFYRAPIEEMLQRAGAAGNIRGPPVPEGPPSYAPGGSGDKGYTFTQLP
jgi:hypothetical protein